MQPTNLLSNPFALMMDPEAVVKAMQCSERLSRLKSRVCRPLDKPLIPSAADVAAEAAGPDDEIDDVAAPAVEG